MRILFSCFILPHQLASGRSKCNHASAKEAHIDPVRLRCIRRILLGFAPIRPALFKPLTPPEMGGTDFFFGDRFLACSITLAPAQNRKAVESPSFIRMAD